MAPRKSQGTAPTETKATTRSSAKVKETQQAAAVQPAPSPVQSSTQPTKDRHVSETILTFSEDIASAEKPPLLPIGEYIAEIRGAEVKESNTTGNKYVSVQFVVNPENYPVDFDPANAPDGKTFTYNRLSAEDDMRARWNMRKFCSAIGAQMAKEIDVSQWVGLTAKISIRHTPYEGEDREEVGKVGSAE